VISEVGWTLTALGLALLVAIALVRDERRAGAERALVQELRDVQAFSAELWDALGPHHYREIVAAYLGRREIFVRANYVLDFWDRAARAYLRGEVNRRRFLPRVAAKCDACWREYIDLIKMLDDQEPQRVAAWRRLRAAAVRHLHGGEKPKEKIKTSRAA
jgi:hypothetical protein